jgi:hypothetical protein
VPPGEALGDLARHGATLVIYLSIKLIEAVVAELIRGYAPETPVVVAYRVSWPDQRLIRGTLATIAALVKEAGIDRQALILVSPALGAGGELRPVQAYDGTSAMDFGPVAGNELYRGRLIVIQAPRVAPVALVRYGFTGTSHENSGPDAARRGPGPAALPELGRSAVLAVPGPGRGTG